MPQERLVLVIDLTPFFVCSLQYINRQLNQSMLCGRLTFTWIEISGGSQWAGKVAPNTT